MCVNQQTPFQHKWVNDRIIYKNVDRISNTITYYDKQNNLYLECVIPFGDKINGFTTHQYNSDLNIKTAVDSINSVKERCGFPILNDNNCCYYSVNDMNVIRSLIKQFDVNTTNNTIYNNYNKVKDGESNYNDLCERILICELLNHHKHLFSDLNKSFFDMLNQSWIESNEVEYGPDLKFIDLHSQKIILYGDVECYVADSNQYVYVRKLKQNRESYYIEKGLNTDLKNVYVFRFIYEKYSGKITHLLCYNIEDIRDLSMDAKYNLKNPTDQRMVLDERRYITIDLKTFNIVRGVRSVNDTLNQGIEQIYFNGTLLRESDQLINYKLLKKKEVKNVTISE